MYKMSEAGRETKSRQNERYNKTESAREAKRRYRERLVYIGGMFIAIGFTDAERKDMLNGTTD
jgi:hypothetical protein